MEPDAQIWVLATMEELEAFSIKVEPDGNGFRWSTHVYGTMYDRSEEMFATRGDAALAAVRAIEKRRSASIAETTARCADK